MAVHYAEDPASQSIEITVDGRVTRDDWEQVVPKFEAFMNEHGTIRLIEVVNSLDGFEMGMIWDGIKFDFKAVPHISHCAVVTDIAWMSPLTRAAGAVMPMKMRVFPLAELTAARRWLQSEDR
ncbi:MAG: STAS/SEC14 domain-containing protein [Pseudomonadota bacterium]